ncbi:cilia- and flagella-associated protein 77-like isoform X2 [Bolinopsis microptera]|uniref:cilia- and flagella-associated protein 77-like isoform X2 n=1 Tax=Bolinopsis microptera TaxID=2820187 RepID=UPI00307993BE
MSALLSDQVVLGEPRNEMNPLLVKPPLGRPLTRCYTAPYNANGTFGQCYNFIDGGVPAALNHFNIAVVKPYNKNGFVAATAGLVKAEEQQAYRASHQVLKAKAAKTMVLTYPKKMSPDFMTFGVPTRPSTPVYDLLENSYQERWIRGMRDAEHAQREQDKQAKRSNNIQDTRTSLMRKKVVKVEDSKLWHMTRWGKVKPFLNTFPSEKAKVKAMSRHYQQKTA